MPRHQRIPPAISRFISRLKPDIARYEPEDLPSVLAFRGHMYGKDSVFVDVDYLRWLYESCPREAARPYFWLYRRDGEVAGHQGAVPLRISIDGELVRAGWLIDSMVHPKYRLRGVGMVMAHLAIQEFPLAAGFEVSDEARKAFLRAGWTDLGTVPRYARILDAQRFLHSRGLSRWPASLARLSRPPQAAFGWATSIVLRATGCRWRQASELDDRINALWERCRGRFRVVAKRDVAWLQWRFLQFPDPARYRVFELEHREELVGYAVLRMGQRQGMLVGHIVDFLCEPTWTSRLLLFCLRQLYRDGAAMAYCLLRHPEAEHLMPRLGFFPRDSCWPLMFRADRLTEDQLEALSDVGNWFLTAADASVDRPRDGTEYVADETWRGARRPS